MGLCESQLYVPTKEKIITSNGNLSIFYAESDLNDNGLYLPSPKSSPIKAFDAD